MNEQKKNAALDEDALEGVTGGGDARPDQLINQAWAKLRERERTNDNKEQQP